MKRSVITGFLVLLLAMIVSTAYARVLVSPAVSIREEYNDNIFLTENDKEDDFITTVTPSVFLEYSPNSKLDLILNYGLNLRLYGDHSEFNNTDLSDTQSIQLNANARPFSRVFIDATDTYDRVAISQRHRTAEGNVFLNKTDRNIFMISPYVVIPITTSASVTAGYEYRNTWHKEDSATDSESHSFFGSLDKKFTTKLTGMLRYKFTKYETDRSDSETGVDGYDKHEGTAGLTYKLSSKFELSSEIGQSSLSARELNDSDSVIWKVSGAYNQSAEGALSAILTYGRSFLDSTVNGASKSDSLDLMVMYGRIYIISVNPYYRVDEFVNVARDDRVFGINTTISKDVSQKVTVSINGLYEKQKFLPEDENVNRFSAGTSIDYRIIKNMTASFGYRFNKRDSDQVGEDYNNNIAWVQGKYDF